MNELINIKVVQKDFNGEKKRFVNARELYQWLGVGRDFSTWMKDRIKKYDFVEDLDYFISIPSSGNGQKAKSKGIIIDARELFCKQFLMFTKQIELLYLQNK